MFSLGFEKISASFYDYKKETPKFKTNKRGIAALGALGIVAGAIEGHKAHAGKHLIYARSGKDYKEKSFIDKHPLVTGAMSLGIAPHASKHQHQLKLDDASQKVQKVLDKYPYANRA